MGKKIILWKKVWENLGESMFKKCEQNCGKNLGESFTVGKAGIYTGFLEVLRGDLNKYFTSVKWAVFHDFHRAYNYYYK